MQILNELLHEPEIGHLISDKLLGWARDCGFKVEDHQEDKCSWWTVNARGRKRPSTPTNQNFMQVDHESHHFTAIDQIIQTVKMNGHLNTEEFIKTLKNTKRFGYEIQKKQ